MWEELWRKFVEADPITKVVSGAMGFVVLSVSGLIITWAWKRLWPRLRSWWDCSGRLARARSAVDERGPGLWLTIGHNPHPPSVVDHLANLGKLVVTIANLKGGVGKTTLAANLCAFFANPSNDGSRPRRRTIVLDLDFQGSCSSMLFAGSEWRPSEGQLSEASEIIGGFIGPTNRGLLGQPVTSVNGARGISAFYDLAAIESREMIRWLIGDENQDIRYRLAHLLLSDAVAKHFDVVLIDAPPRLTTASIQALCASTHVLIPTVLDPLSADAVGYFGQQLKAHEELWPHLRVIGVVGTMTNKQREDAESKALTTAGDRLRAALEGSKGKLTHVQARGTPFEFPYEFSVFERSALSRAAGQGIAYVSRVKKDRDEVQQVIDPLGMEMQRRWQQL